MLTQIPKIIHQLWKNEQVPDRFQALVRSWRTQHPDWAYRLWTDADIETFVRSTYPALWPMLEEYRHPICRADAARYLILRHYGGLYVDLDFESFRPIGPLLEGASFAIGAEPAEHASLDKAVVRNVQELLCPSLIASVPNHPFWDHVISHLQEARKCDDPLDATGPFLLTHAYASFADKASVTILPTPAIYPVSKQQCWDGELFNLDVWDDATRNAYALHHWDGSWFRIGETEPRPRQLQVELLNPSRRGPAVALPVGNEAPLISCLMVTRDRFSQAQLAVEAFRRQTYARRELVIVDDGTDERLAEEVRRLNDPTVRILRRPDHGETLGNLRNVAVSQAQGDYVCQWDDDDLYDPLRLELQMIGLLSSGARACMLKRWTMWWPADGRVALSHARTWEGSLLCEKAIMPPYPGIRSGEDTPVINTLCRTVCVAMLDLPRLYLYVVHGRNTFDNQHFEEFWWQASRRFEGERGTLVRTELEKRLALSAYLQTLPNAQSTQNGLGVVLFGTLGGGFGLSVAAEGTRTALETTGLPLDTVDIGIEGKWPNAQARANRVTSTQPIAIVHTNPDHLRYWHLCRTRAGYHDDPLQGRIAIGYWAWESPNTLPSLWHEALERYDEIWVPSRYVAHALSLVSPVPVVDMPHPVQPLISSIDRAALGLPKDRCIFLCMFDELSGFNRKNPMGVIEAFRRAFPDDGSAVLVVKARSLSTSNHARLEAAADGHRSVLLRIGEDPPHVAAGLMGACDAFISLHRAEGFGLSIAEAMHFSKPVIVTGHSGNMDFTTAANSFLVKHSLYALEQDDGVYPKGTIWADPDLDHAAALMQEVVGNPSAARAVGERAAADVRSALSPQTVGARMKKRLGIVQKRLSSASKPAPVPVDVRDDPAVPGVLVLTPVKNARRTLPAYFDALAKLDYPSDRLSLGLLEGDSTDGSAEFLAERLPDLRSRYRRVTLIKHDEGLQFTGPRWAPEVQRPRRSTLSRVRNRLISMALTDEPWVLWVDADVVDFPPGILRALLGSGRRIVAPHCVTEPGGPTFDLNTFRFKPHAREIERAYFVDGIIQPPRGITRDYPDSLRGQGCVPVDSVGGAMLLVDADLHRDGLLFPPVSYGGYLETEGFAMMARDAGHTAWLLPDLEVIHARS